MPLPKNRLPPRTDSGNAELFACLNEDRLRFDHLRDRWFIFRKHWWREDEDGEIFQYAKQAMRYRLQCAVCIPNDDERQKQTKWAVASESRTRLEAVIALGKTERAIADQGKKWDSNPWTFGVQNGVVDLRTAKLRPGQPSDLITLHSEFAFDPSAKCPRWLQFLDQLFLSDHEMIDFIQRAVGYSLTADTREQCTFLCWGEGSNGKTTFLEVLRRIFGTYAHTLPFSAFELNARASIPNDIAPLVGRRFVSALETNETVRLNEARIKTLTGEDPIAARFLYREFFTFRPVGKIWLAFNHKPLVGDDSHGFWRRIRLIPFSATFADGNVDKELVPKLLSEAEGILAWAVHGCLAWQNSGLGLPPTVTDATASYRAESDPLSDFLGECCVVHPNAQVEVALLWTHYVDWAKETAVRWPLPRRQFTNRLEALGLKRIRTGHERTRTWAGICRLQDVQGQHFSVVVETRTDAAAKIQ